jgi:tRNA dimethylallyltransferase
MGPTASGKSALAVQLAQNLNAEIISVDSVLVYRGMDIGTAKPTQSERGGIKHHLIDILDPAESFSTGMFRKLALDLMADITRKGKIPLLAGGTMMYFNTLFNGLSELPVANEEIRTKLDLQARAEGWAAMHRRLAEVDPISAEKIHPNDPQRIQRALEVFEISGEPISVWHVRTKQPQLPYQKIKIVIAPDDRSLLHERIAVRFKAMLEQGFVEEVKKLLHRGDLSDKMPSVRAVGYRQVWAYLQGGYNQETMIEKGVVATRQLAKRQITWLRREKDAIWFDSNLNNLFDRVIANLMVK